MTKIQEIYDRRGFVLAAEIPEAAGCSSIVSKGEHPKLVRLTCESTLLGCDIHYFANPLELALPLSNDRQAVIVAAFIEHVAARKGKRQ
jgi:hypothetical protein